MKYNNIVKENMEVKNNVLVACVCSIVLLLTLCYFGVNSGVKETYAAATLCDDMFLNGCSDEVYHYECSNVWTAQSIVDYNGTAYCLRQNYYIRIDSNTEMTYCSIEVSDKSSYTIDNNWTCTGTGPYVCSTSTLDRCLSEAEVTYVSITQDSITYNVNGGLLYLLNGKSTGETTYTGSSQTLLNAKRANYDFLGWYLNDVKFGDPGDIKEIDGRVTLDAKWRAFTVTYDANGGSVSKTSEIGPYITLPEVTHSSSFMEFAGWYLESEINDDSADPVGQMGDSYTVTENITLVAKWNYTPFKITYDFNGGGGSAPEIVYIVEDEEGNTTTTLPRDNDNTANSVWRNGYKLCGWFRSSTMSESTFVGNPGDTFDPEKHATDSEKEYKGIMLVAGWVQEDSMCPSYTNAGNSVEDDDSTGGNDNSSGGSSGNGGGSTTTSETFTATFSENGGTLNGNPTKSCTTETGSDSCTVMGLPTATKNGYTFKGWGNSSSCTSGSTDSLTLTGNKTVHACWISDSTGGDDDSTGTGGGNNEVDEDGNVTKNEPTGENIVMALVWFIGMFAIGYSVYYFKSIKEN